MLYKKWKGQSLFDTSIINLSKNTFKVQERNQSTFWGGGKGTFFGLHRDAKDEMIANYVVYGRKKWWIIKKAKRNLFQETIYSIIGSKLSSEKHILEHERLWIDGDWLSQKYPEIEIDTIVQEENQFVVLTQSDIYHWGVNLESTLAEITILKRGKEINHEKQSCSCII